MNADISSLIAQLEGTDSAQQIDAANQLATLGHAAQGAAVALVRTVGLPHEEVLEACTAALEDLGPPDAEQLPQLAELAHDCTSDVAYWAITLLGRAGSTSAATVPALVRVLESPADLPVRERAAWALGEIGPAAQSAAPSLRAAASGPDARLARLAANALEAVGG